MFEKLTPSLDRIIKSSQQIAREYEQDYVGTEHLLLAILKDGSSLAAKILIDSGVNLANTKVIIDRIIKGTLEDTWVFGRLPGTPHFRNVMAAAIEEARQLESKVVSPEHMLIALAREDGSVASAALAELGVKAPRIRSEVNKHMEAGHFDPKPDTQI
jgi:ATP-dependent Clp protease ATP-binding subunit ClpC